MKTETVWEVDFHPCPLLDDNQKRVWELLVCDASGAWRQQCYASNQDVNSRWVADRLQEFLAQAPAPPLMMRIFRMRMAALLQRSGELIGIPTRLSRRVYALNQWYQERQAQVYPQESAYTYKLEAMPSPEYDDPQPLPDALQGERWALVTLRAKDFLSPWASEFGELLPIDWTTRDPEQVIPGLLITSGRARAMAAWMSGLDPYAVRIEDNAELVLEVGGTACYSFARLTSDSLRQEAKGFQQRVEENGGIHFIAIQASLQAQSFAGFWLLALLDLEG
ncbi:MAG: Tab2/Atab2 family RNA-binding protein [Synechococcales cyanobacterium]